VPEVVAEPPAPEPPEQPEQIEMKPVEKKPEPKPKRSAIETAWDAGNYRDIVSRCTKAFPSNSDDVRCALAACKVKSENKARTFLAKIDKGKRKAVINACKNADVDLEAAPPEKKPPEPRKPPEPKKDCENDPMSCQH
jgi:hypothetical protein